MDNLAEVEIRSEHYAKIQELVSNSKAFGSVSEYLNYVLDLLFEEQVADIQQMSKEEERRIHERLKDLGYV